MNTSPKKNPKILNQYKAYLKYSSLAFQMLVVMAVAVWGGVKLDQLLNIKFPVFTLLFSISSLIGIIYYLIRSVSEDKFNE